MKRKSLNLELKIWENYPLIAGVDEAGRGALAGPLVVAAVILPVWFQNPLIQDSKVISSIQRKKAYLEIKKAAIEYNIIFKNAREIEIKNPLAATKEAMKEAILGLKNKPCLALIDGKEKVRVEGINSISIVGGDRKSINIAAASIIAKVTRDSLMQELHEKYPIYNFFKNKGYPNKMHLSAVFSYGICDIHRKNYEPIKSLIQPNCDKAKIRRRYKF